MPEPTLVELLDGKGAHANSIACVQGLTPEMASRHIAGFPHSISQLVSHLNYWIEYDVKRIRGEQPPYPTHADESWPESSKIVDDVTWRHETARFTALLGEVAALAVLGPQKLDQKVDAMHPAHEQQSSVLAVLWQTVVHNSYHLGQIALLRRALGAWPRPGGGDSW
jgi:uncharacterized damage-inducible protein DinB